MPCAAFSWEKRSSLARWPFVQVSVREGQQELAAVPMMVRNNLGYHQHHFVALGIGFWLCVGKGLPATHLTLCHAPDPNQIIIVSEKLDAQFYSSVEHMVHLHPDPRKSA